MPDSQSTRSEPTQEQLAEEHAAHVKAREFDFDVQVNFPRRLILTVFPPLIAVLLTYSMDWHDPFVYWSTCSLITAAYLWILWAPEPRGEA